MWVRGEVYAHTDCLIHRWRKITTTGEHATKLFDLCTYEIAFCSKERFLMCARKNVRSKTLFHLLMHGQCCTRSPLLMHGQCCTRSPLEAFCQVNASELFPQI